MWKEDDITDRGGVGQQHHKPVNSNSFPCCRGHTIFQGTDIILIQFRMDLFIITPLSNLFFETFELIFRIVELAEGIGDFPTGYKQFETIGYTWIFLVASGQGRNFGRV